MDTIALAKNRCGRWERRNDLSPFPPRVRPSASSALPGGAKKASSILTYQFVTESLERTKNGADDFANDAAVCVSAHPRGLDGMIVELAGFDISPWTSQTMQRT